MAAPPVNSVQKRGNQFASFQTIRIVPGVQHGLSARSAHLSCVLRRLSAPELGTLYSGLYQWYIPEFR